MAQNKLRSNLIEVSHHTSGGDAFVKACLLVGSPASFPKAQTNTGRCWLNCPGMESFTTSRNNTTLLGRTINFTCLLIMAFTVAPHCFFQAAKRVLMSTAGSVESDLCKTTSSKTNGFGKLGPRKQTLEVTWTRKQMT